MCVCVCVCVCVSVCLGGIPNGIIFQILPLMGRFSLTSNINREIIFEAKIFIYPRHPQVHILFTPSYLSVMICRCKHDVMSQTI